MTKPGWCHRSTMLCNSEQCVLFVAELDQCFDEIEKNYKLSQMRTTGTIQAPPPRKQPSLGKEVEPALAGTAGVIQRILAMRPNLTKEAVERLIDEERAKAAGLLTEEATAHLVASNLGLDRSIPQRFPDFEEGNYETLTGEIVEPAETREVNTRSGPKMVSNVFLTDGETKVRVGLWNELVDEIEKYGKGDVVTITNLSVKAPYDEVVQLSSTKNTKISR